MNIGHIDPIGDEMRELARFNFEQMIDRDNALYEIRQNTASMDHRIEDANERILLLNKQLDATNEELRKTRNECDTVNKQFFAYQKEQTKRSNESTFLSVTAIIIALISLLVSYFK